MADPNSLAIFAKVVEASGILEAARRLKVLISTVGRRIAGPENQFGVCLLERSTRNTGNRSLPRRVSRQDPCIVDATFRPFASCFSPGNVADIPVVPARLASTPLSRQFRADQATMHASFASAWPKKGALVV
jgi:hypothetical protein